MVWRIQFGQEKLKNTIDDVVNICNCDGVFSSIVCTHSVGVNA